MPYFDLLKAVAQVVGGTQPSLTQTSVSPALQPYWYSGVDAGDGSGVAGIAGCFSVPTDSIQATPVGMVLQGPWKPDTTVASGPRQGHKYSEEQIHVRVMVGHDDEPDLMAALANFRDTVPTAFDTHMQLLQTTGVMQAWCADGDFLEVEWAGNVYLSLVFIVTVLRALPVTYVG